LINNAHRKYLQTEAEGWAGVDPKTQPDGPRNQLDQHFHPFTVGIKSLKRARTIGDLYGKVGGVDHMIKLASQNKLQKLGFNNPWDVNPGNDGGTMTGLHRQAKLSMKREKKNKTQRLDVTAL